MVYEVEWTHSEEVPGSPFTIELDLDYWNKGLTVEPKAITLDIVDGPVLDSWVEYHTSKRYIFPNKPRPITVVGYTYEVKIVE